MERVVVCGVRVVVWWPDEREWWFGFVCGGGLCVAERGRVLERERDRVL